MIGKSKGDLREHRKAGKKQQKNKIKREEDASKKVQGTKK